jgi:hypothetical protein
MPDGGQGRSGAIGACWSRFQWRPMSADSLPSQKAPAAFPESWRGIAQPASLCYEHFGHRNCEVIMNRLITAFGATTGNGIELLVGQFDDAALWVVSAIGHGLLLCKKMTLLLSPSGDCDA